MIVLKRSGEQYPVAVTRIQQAVINQGFICSREQAEVLWTMYSDSQRAQWSTLPADDLDIWKAVRDFVKVVERSAD